ncbi:MAG: hypothetical protein ABIP68_00670 [Ferruginibacter sp.]
MTIVIIITLCSLLLLAYLFDVSSKWTRIPSVLLLLLLGGIVRETTVVMGVQMPDLYPVLPILGTIGLILIVLEGALELEFNRSKLKLIKKSFFVALIPMVILTFVLAFVFQYYSGYSFKDCITNAVPFSVISSSIAISSAANLPSFSKEFVTYESSFSDILGVLFFNFVALNAVIDLGSVWWFILQLIIVAIISFLSIIGLSILMSKIEHKTKYAPIILLVVLIYEVSQIYHLPALVFILLFGLFLGNLGEIKNAKWLAKLKPDQLIIEVHKLKDIITEATFLIRSLFFLLFGYFIKLEDIINVQSFLLAGIIVVAIYVVRFFQLKASGLPSLPLVFIAPRGLINILLFLAIIPAYQIPIVGTPLLIQVIILTSALMMLGMVFVKKEDLKKGDIESNDIDENNSVPIKTE